MSVIAMLFDYLSNVFKKENKSRKNSSLPYPPRSYRCNTNYADRNLRIKTRKAVTECEKCSLINIKRYQSCSRIDKLESTNLREANHCKNCFSKLSYPHNPAGNQRELFDSQRESDGPMNTSNPRCHQENSKPLHSVPSNYSPDLSNEPWRSWGFAEPTKNDSSLKRVHSADSNISEYRKDFKVTEWKETCNSIPKLPSGENKYLTELEKSKVPLVWCPDRKPSNGLKTDINNSKCKNNCTPKLPYSSHAKGNDSGIGSEASNRTSTDDFYLHVSRYFDAEPWLPQDSEYTDTAFNYKTGHNIHGSIVEKMSERQLKEVIPEYHAFQPLILMDKAEQDYASSEEFKNDVRKTRISTHKNEGGAWSCKSRIPVLLNNRHVKNTYGNSLNNRFRNDGRFGWKQSSIFPGCHSRNCYCNAGIAYRSLLNAKLERNFRDFTKKIYRGNIIDHVSHSRWMKQAGIFEEENAASFKKYAKRKVVLTLPEYKEALTKMCEDYGLDYWETLKRMTDVNNRSDSKLLSNDLRDKLLKIRHHHEL